jgi:putative tryptophan/tyrosine transport system substrate-binding protein
VTTHRLRINTFALAARVPTMYVQRELAEAAGLMSYGANYRDLNRRVADFVDKILRGAKPADIPVEQPTKFDLVINLVTAKALGITVPPTLLARGGDPRRVLRTPRHSRPEGQEGSLARLGPGAACIRDQYGWLCRA